LVSYEEENMSDVRNSWRIQLLNQLLVKKVPEAKI